MESKDGQLIGMELGTCRLVRHLGAGGMGTVFLAQQQRPSREVAVKMLQTRYMGGHTEQQEFLARFRREADVIARLDHVNITPIYEYGEQNGYAYLVMPYFAGGGLRDLLQRKRSLEPREALGYIEQAASALDYAHSKNIIHRDIKPANILFHGDGRLVLVDFGIARIVTNETSGADSSLTATGQFIGSVEYMAPEMIQGQPVDYRADIYELGVVLYQMLSGRVPFVGETLFTIANKHMHEMPQSLTQMKTDISPAVDAVVQRALAKRPEERYQRASELAQALREAVLEGVYRDATTVQGVVPPVQPLALSSGQVSHSEPTQVGMAYPPSTDVPDSRNYGSRSEGRSQSQQQSQYQQQFSHSGSNVGMVGQGYQEVYGRRVEKRGNGVLVGVIVVLVLVSIVLGGGGLWMSGAFGELPWTVQPTEAVTGGGTSEKPTEQGETPEPTPTPDKKEEARSVITRYYDEVNAKNYEAAYNMWGNEWRGSNSYDEFADGYKNTERVEIEFGEIIEREDGLIDVAVKITAKEKKGKPKRFEGVYVVGEEEGQWRILTANLSDGK